MAENFKCCVIPNQHFLKDCLFLTIFRTYTPDMPASDERKNFILVTFANHFSVDAEKLSDLHGSSELNNFLDDGSCSVLVTKLHSGKPTFYNEVTQEHIFTT